MDNAASMVYDEASSHQTESVMQDHAVRAEAQRRQQMWQALIEQGGPEAVPAAVLRELGIYGGAQGVWVDKVRTAPCTDDGMGVSVGLLHTGRHYADDLSEDGVLYHYPKTDRPAARDANEVDATKNAGRLGLPVFVISQRDHTRRDVRRAWVAEWDDASRLFLITFEDAPSREPLNGEPAAHAIPDDAPFSAFTSDRGTYRAVRDRPGQQQFKFAVLKRYGPKCGVCDVSVVDLLQAAHIIPKEQRGTDDPRNGLVLCANHHLAFDAGLFAIDPDTLALRVKPDGPTSQALCLAATHLSQVHGSPHDEALTWRFARWTHTIA
jgi:putative restriction endonuclease